MSQHNPSLNNPAGWQLLGELDLAAGSRSEEKMHAWLVETLHPLHLHEDFLDRILKSSQAMETGGRRGEAGPVHLLVYAQSNLSEGQTWGFFRIEKAGKAGLSHHSIELYLYQEDSLD